MTTPLAIMTNIGSLTAQTNLSRTTGRLQQSISRLSSGLRIQSAADDAAGMAVSENMRGQLKGFQQALRNANDGVSILQTAEGAYGQVSNDLVRMRELAVQASNDSLSDTERGYLNTEFQALSTEITRISNVTEYNGQKLLAGTAGDGSGNMVFQVGTRNTTNDRINITLGAQDSSTLGVASSAVDTLSNAQSAIDAIDGALDTVNTARAGLGATVNQLTAAADNLNATIEHYGESVSQIRDVNMASESANFSKTQVLQQAGVAVLAQANSMPNLALRLLQ